MCKMYKINHIFCLLFFQCRYFSLIREEISNSFRPIAERAVEDIFSNERTQPTHRGNKMMENYNQVQESAFTGNDFHLGTI